MKTQKNSTQAQCGFTLIEMIAVVAIIGILGIIASPMYNNYATKSKFSEVALATAPTKTAISACAVAGDCVSGTADSAHIDLTTAPVSTAQTTCAMVPTTTQVKHVGFYSAGSGCSSKLSYTSGPYECDVSYTTSTVYNNVCTTTGGVSVGLLNLPCVGTNDSSGGCAPPTKYVSSVSYDAAGVITGTAAASASGLHGETFVLKPAYSGGRVDWSVSGSCKTRAGGALC